MSLSEFYWPRKEVRTAMVGWLIFLCGASIYCILYNQMVLLTPRSLLHSFTWSLQEYTPWLVITPVLLMLLQRFPLKPGRINIASIAGLLTTTLLIALFTRIAINLYLNPKADFLTNLVYFFPKQLFTLTIIVSLWMIYRTSVKSREATVEKADRNEKQQLADQILVMKGNGEKLIRRDSIISITAAGNYLELSTEDDQCLLRTTMKELNEKLPQNQFIRTHRSHIVNIAKIEKITSLAAGNGLVHLCNGQIIPLSKSYKKQLKTFKWTEN